MPEYLFENPNTGEVKSVFQQMTDLHEYEENGIKFNRIFCIPSASKDTKIDEFNEKDFVEKTRDKRGSLGEIWDRSSELSRKREEKAGKDPVKQKYYSEWSKRRRGKKHPKAIEEGY